MALGDQWAWKFESAGKNSVWENNRINVSPLDSLNLSLINCCLSLCCFGMEKSKKGYSAKAFLDNDLNSVDEIIGQFDAYKRSRRRDQLEFEHQLSNLNINADFDELSTSIENLRVGLQELQKQRQLQQTDLDAIEPAPLEEGACSSQTDIEDRESDQLVVNNGMSQCVYHECQRIVNSQLLLLHYLCDHNQPDSHCLSVLEGEQAVLSFQPRSCVFRVNKVLGLLAYGGKLEDQFRVTQRRPKIYNAFLPDHHSHLATQVPVVVLICHTATRAILKSKTFEPSEQWLSNNQRYTDFVIWLVTPSDRHRLNARLHLCGRDAAVRTATTIGVRQVKHCQDTARFMTVDSNYWRLAYTDMERLTNKFRDELHLEIVLSEP